MAGHLTTAELLDMTVAERVDAIAAVTTFDPAEMSETSRVAHREMLDEIEAKNAS